LHGVCHAADLADNPGLSRATQGLMIPENQDQDQNQDQSRRRNVIMRTGHWLFSSIGATFLALAGAGSLHAQPFAIVGNDEKVLWDKKGDTILWRPARIRW
jgi:predicted anti-sigma-YlaC factor YlaD